MQIQLIVCLGSDADMQLTSRELMKLCMTVNETMPGFMLVKELDRTCTFQLTLSKKLTQTGQSVLKSGNF